VASNLEPVDLYVFHRGEDLVTIPGREAIVGEELANRIPFGARCVSWPFVESG
jgi:hypothetical protein